MKKNKNVRLVLGILAAVFFVGPPIYLNWKKGLEDAAHVNPGRQPNQVPPLNQNGHPVDRYFPNEDKVPSEPESAIEQPSVTVERTPESAPTKITEESSATKDVPAIPSDIRQQAEMYIQQNGAGSITPDKIDRAYEKFMGRSPSSLEKEQALQMLNGQ